MPNVIVLSVFMLNVIFSECLNAESRGTYITVTAGYNFLLSKPILYKLVHFMNNILQDS
jgi:hypothetical protein